MLGRQKVAVEDVPVPVPGDGEVLVKMEASALCGSELNRYREDDPPRGNGGHEGVGVVADANRSERCKEGDRVGIYGPFGCGLPDCRYCSRGMDSLCPHHVHTGELHADFAVVNEKTLMPIPDDVPTHAAVLISGDGLGVPYHLSRRLMPGPDDRVVVFGCGPIGLGNVQLQHHYGAEVIAVDLVPKRLELARELGAAHTVDSSSTDPIEAVADLTNGEKAHLLGLPLWIVVPNRQTYRAVAKKLAKAALCPGGQPIRILLPGQLAQALTNHFPTFSSANERTENGKTNRSGRTIQPHRDPGCKSAGPT